MKEQTMDRILYVLYVNDKGFLSYDDRFVLHIINARYFRSRKEAETYRTKLYKGDNDLFQLHAISILEWK